MSEANLICVRISFKFMTNQARKIGVTGAAGFIGSNLCEALLLQGSYKIIALDNLSTSTENNLRDILPNINMAFYQLDITDKRRTANILRGVHTIIHLASYKIPRYGKRLETLLLNTKSTENILDIARNNGAKVIFGSTSDVYGKNPKLPFKESSDNVLGPPEVARWAYATSKIFDEHLCFGYWENFGLPFVILRFFNVYGPRQSRNWLGGPQSLFIDRIISGHEVEIHGTGQQTRAFSYVGDIVKAIIKTIDESKAIANVINLGSTEEISVIDLAKLISKLTKLPLKIKKVSYESFTGKTYEDVLRRYPDVKKAKKILDWQPSTPLIIGLKKTIRLHKQNPI